MDAYGGTPAVWSGMTHAPPLNDPGFVIKGANPPLRVHEALPMLPTVRDYTPIMQPNQRYEPVMAPGAKTLDHLTPVQTEEFLFRHMGKNSTDLYRGGTQMDVGHYINKVHDRKIIEWNGRLIYVKADPLNAEVWTYEGEVYKASEGDLRDPLEGPHHAVEGTCGIGRSDYWKSPVVKGWGRSQYSGPQPVTVKGYFYKPMPSVSGSYPHWHDAKTNRYVEQHVKLGPERRDFGKGLINKTHNGQYDIRYSNWSNKANSMF